MAESENEQQMAERLEELEDKIQHAKRRAMDDDLIDDPDEPRFYESGTIGADEDDQTIAPG